MSQNVGLLLLFLLLLGISDINFYTKHHHGCSKVLAATSLTVSVETVSISEFFQLGYQNLDYNPSSNLNTFSQNAYTKYHIVHIQSNQLAVVPFTTLNSSGVIAQDEAILNELAQIYETKNLSNFIKKNALLQEAASLSSGEELDYMYACCTDDDLRMMEAWNQSNFMDETSSSSRRKKSILASSVSITNSQKKSVSFYSKLENEHWLLDQLWSDIPIIVIPIEYLDHLFLNLKNNIYMASFKENQIQKEVNSYELEDLFHLVGTEGVLTMTVVKTSPQVSSSEELMSLLTDEQKAEISQAIKKNIQENILDKLLRFEKSCNVTNSTAITQMRDYHDALLRKSMGFGYFSEQQSQALSYYLYLNAFYSNNLELEQLPTLSYTNSFFWTAMESLYNETDLKTVLESEGYSTTNQLFNQTFLLQVFDGFKKNLNQYITGNFYQAQCYSGFNDYLGMFHYYSYSSYEFFMFKDGILYTASSLAIVFYICLIFTMILNRKKKNIPIRRRFLLPFIGPFCLFVIPIYFLEPVWNRQYISVFSRSDLTFSVTAIYPNFFISLFFSTYIVTVLRFYHLKNLYWFMNLVASKKKVISQRSLKFQKILTSKIMATVFTIILTVCIFLIWLSYYTTSYDSPKAYEVSAYNMQVELLFLVPFATLCLVASIICLIILVIDLILNRRKLKQRGIFYFFLFDDPFFLRIDLIIMILNLVISALIFMSLSGETNYAGKGLLLALFILCYLVVGGNTMLIETIRFLANLFKKQNYQSLMEDNSIQKLLKDNDFREILRIYSRNEHSIENLALYETMEQFKKNGVVTHKDLLEVYQTFVQMFAPFEINLSSDGRGKFMELLQREANVPYSDLDEVCMRELLMNLTDTISRLETTTQYESWLETKKLKKDIELNV